MKKVFKKSVFQVSAFVLLAVLFLGGCSDTGSSGAGGFGGGLTAPKDQWTVVVKRFAPGQEKFADVVVNTLVRVKMDRSKIKKVRVGDQTVVMYGEYANIDDPRAQQDMKYIKSLVVPDQGYPFLDAHLEPIPEPDPFVPSTWLLAKSNGYWTLQIAQFDGPGRKKNAVDLTQQLRKKNIPAYVYHGPVKSWVTIGAYPENAIGSAGKQRISRQLNIVNPDLKKWKRQYPNLLINSDYAKFSTKQKGKEVKILLESQVIRVPRSGEMLW